MMMMEISDIVATILLSALVAAGWYLWRKSLLKGIDVVILLAVVLALDVWGSPVGITGIDLIIFALLALFGSVGARKREQEIAGKLQRVGAISPETAVKPQDARISKSDLFLDIFAEKTEDGRYYVECKDKKHC
jgi:hypothetical protein